MRLKLLFTALVALVFGSITASFDIAPAAAGGTYTYDVSAIARVEPAGLLHQVRVGVGVC